MEKIEKKSPDLREPDEGSFSQNHNSSIMRGKKKTAVSTNRLKIIWFFCLIFLWEGIVWSGQVNPLIMPSLRDVSKTLINGFADGTLLLQTVQSVGMVLTGIVISGLCGITMAYMDYNYRSLQALFELLSSMLHPLPGVAVLPIIVLWAGVGKNAVFLVIIHAIIWSFYLNVKAGFTGVEKALVEVAHNNGASKIQLFWYTLLPMSLDAVVLGMQIGWSRGWRALISAEMIFGTISAVGGLGWYIYERRAFMDTSGMFAGVVVIAVIGLLVEQFVFHRLIPKLWSRS